MNRLKPKNIILFILLLIALIAVGYYYFYVFNKQKVNSYLASIEIRQYQGKNLSSINDFVENSIKGPQYIDKNNYRLQLTGLLGNPQEFTYDSLINKYPSYKKAVELDCVQGWSVNILWEGILFKDMFKDLAIKPEANTVIFYAVDGYTTSFPISYLTDNNIIMAYKMNGVTIPPERGFPFMLVAESKWGYKWIKWITRIEFSADSNYKGYWESRGYNASGDLNRPFTP